MLQTIYNIYNYIISKLINLNAKVDANNNFLRIMVSITFSIVRMATFLHNIVNIEQAPKLLKDQIRMNASIYKYGYNLRNKFQVNQPLRLHNHYGVEVLFLMI